MGGWLVQSFARKDRVGEERVGDGTTIATLSVWSLARIDVRPDMALQRNRRPRFLSGRSLRSLGSPLNDRPLGDGSQRLT